MIVAYWSFFFPTDEIIDRISTGEFAEGSLTESDVLVVRGPMKRPIYVSMLTMHPAISNNNRVRHLLYHSMLTAIDDLKANEIDITDIYAHAFTAHGRNIARKMGLTDVVGVGDHPLLKGVWNAEMRKKLFRHSKRAAEQLPD